MFYWVLKMLVIGPIARLLFRPWVEGQEHIPESGPAIFASNHLSFSDSVFLPLVVPRRMTFLAKSDYFTGKGIKGRLTAAFFRGIGQLPIDRSGGKAGEAALSSGLRVLRRGQLLGIRLAVILVACAALGLGQRRRGDAGCQEGREHGLRHP